MSDDPPKTLCFFSGTTSPGPAHVPRSPAIPMKQRAFSLGSADLAGAVDVALHPTGWDMPTSPSAALGRGGRELVDHRPHAATRRPPSRWTRAPWRGRSSPSLCARVLVEVEAHQRASPERAGKDVAEERGHVTLV